MERSGGRKTIYEVKAKGYKLVVNGEAVKLKNLMSKKSGMWKIYELPLGAKKAEYYVNNWIGGVKLVMDGVDCATGKPFTAPELPKWAYVFLIVHLAYILFLMGGALGVLMAFLGMVATISVSCNKNMSVAVRVLLDSSRFQGRYLAGFSGFEGKRRTYYECV